MMCPQEVLTRNIPYFEQSRDILVMHSIIQGKLPSFPENQPQDEQALRSICNECWDKDPKTRPTMSDLLAEIEKIRLGQRLRHSFRA